MINPYEECPSFERCSCNVCPLDPFISDKFALPGDGKCIAHKPTRLRIGLKYKELLPMGGLKIREFRNKQRWDALPPAKRELIAATLEKARKIQQERHLNKLLEA